MKITRLFLALILIPLAAIAGENRGRSHDELPTEQRHFIVQTQHPLRPAEKSELEARGIEIQHVLPNNRYLVRAADVHQIESDPRVQAVVSYGASKKIAPSAYREAAAGRALAHVRLIFHDDVSFDDARAAVEDAGGTIDRPLSVDFDSPHRLVALIPSTALETLASNERVFGIYGPPLRPAVHNSDAALLSNVTPLYSAPYGLSGQGVVLSEFELSAADVTHPEFQGRLTVDVDFGTATSDVGHATHVAGTMIAAGLDPLAKGMAPAAALHEFSATSDTLMTDKQNLLPPLEIVADNNSWGFQLGWQGDGTAPGNLVWYDAIEFFGGYDGFYSAPYDKIARTGPVLFVHSAGNDGTSGRPHLDAVNFSEHGHADNNGNLIKGETFCYSKDGSGADCPTPFCSTPLLTHCETMQHPTYGPFSTMGVFSSTKDVVAVGAVNQSGVIASFSSRGPTADGRVKPDVVAMGVSQYSTISNNNYGILSGTSMSSPVVTGMCALLTEQWRRTFAGHNPTPQILKTLLIAGADDLGNPGPDYTYGFGLVDAKASVDLIIADNNSGSHVRDGDISQGQRIDIPFALSAPLNVRIVLGWADPEVLLSPDELASKTLVNDLDVKVIGPGGTVLPYVLDPGNPTANATHGVNNTDNVEEIEISNAPPGRYDVILTGTNVATGPTQRYVLVSKNAALGPICTDIYEPNDTEATAFGPLASGIAIGARLCSATDVDFYKFTAAVPGTVAVTMTITDTPVKLTLFSNGAQVATKTIAAGATDGVSVDLPSIVSAPTTDAMMVKVEPAGTIGANASYTLTPVYSFVIPPRRRTSRH